MQLPFWRPRAPGQGEAHSPPLSDVEKEDAGAFRGLSALAFIDRLSPLLDRWWYAILVSLLYPTLHAIGHNWFAFEPRKIGWLLALPFLITAAVAVVGWTAASALRRLPAQWRLGEGAARIGGALLGLVCAGVLALLLRGALLEAVRSPLAANLVTAGAAAGIALLFASGRGRIYSGFLTVLASIALLSWVWSVGEQTFFASKTARQLAEKADFESFRFKEKPNIYLFIYDAYGSRDVYLKNFKFDNSAHYANLEQRGFKVVHGFSSYFATWPTTLSLFLGRHHYYKPSAGISDTKFGRKILAGLSHNSVLNTLWSNGYRTQYIHGIDYFVSEQGKIDFVYPEQPAYGVLRAFDSPWITALVGQRMVLAGQRTIGEQKDVLISRLPEPAGNGSAPWFTFAHINLPAHGPLNKTWKDLASFETVFVERTRDANAHMLEIMDRIVAQDPKAVVIVVGDHGPWRYRGAALSHADPNEAIAAAGLSAETVALDHFGVMTAIRSDGRCDGFIYPEITSVNVARAVFACLAGETLPAERPEDISIALVKSKKFVAARDGAALSRWTEITAP